jgi:hypothetical protein
VEVAPPAAGAAGSQAAVDDGAAGAPFYRDVWVTGLVALALRVAVAAWAAPRLPPAADGTFYHQVAQRIASGLGYTWLWPDGVVTYAAHYPVGYPALMGAVYAVVGARPGAVMGLNAILGALAAVAVHRLAARAGSRRAAWIAGLLVAVHPGLVAYTPALMTEGATAALLACAAWAAAAAKDSLDQKAERGRALVFMIASGLIMGVATLVRPQSIALAPIFGWITWRGAASSRRAALGAAAAAAIAALLVCAPWTLRNCVRMKSCALVSVNGGWNLLIGADAESTGAWSPIKLPEACREVFDEAQKDACFGREARKYIRDNPLVWLALAPRKLAATFDYCGAGSAYMSMSNPEALSDKGRATIGAIEMVFERAVLLLSLLWAALSHLRSRERRPITSIAGIVIAGVGAVFLVLVHAWVSYLAFVITALLRGRALLRGPVLVSASAAILGATMLTHAVFFGAGRYSLVTFPLLCGVAALATSDARRSAPHKPSRALGS